MASSDRHSAAHPWGRVYFTKNNIHCTDQDEWTSVTYEVWARQAGYISHTFLRENERDAHNLMRLLDAAYRHGKIDQNAAIRDLLGISPRAAHSPPS